MKKLLQIVIIFFAIFDVNCQVNLVPNPSFEDTIGCFSSYDESVKYWKTFKGSPDFFSPFCSQSIITTFGNILPHSGNSYSGMITYDEISSNPNLREYMGVELSTSLTIGEKYFFSFFLSPAYNGGSYNLAVNNVGILFTTYYYYDPFMEIPIPNFSHLKVEEIESIPGNWKKVSGHFLADSAYTYLALGNFYFNNLTDTVYISSTVPPHRAYTLIDDVCVSADSLYNENWITLNLENLSNNILVFPNPSSDFLQIKANKSIKNIELYNNLGQMVLNTENINNNEIIIDVRTIDKGIYFIKAESFKLKKIVIN